MKDTERYSSFEIWLVSSKKSIEKCWYSWKSLHFGNISDKYNKRWKAVFWNSIRITEICNFIEIWWFDKNRQFSM